ncbi:HTH-type transcriptional repressor YvoA [Aquimixticola soesokkakensis]|uniref:HTH-type transcriptional repressor YvoA n=1 Tax=Aquimixticola soesokkakensis TaxID=1519096 RepID=A0A1Y5RSY2_9RHOB|nr:GntR family transcriptional regulator [Aquimixticola soesokkakensis]SLN24292.1 HTH-type transcriptional repressor YvoA [Aquimixticola soesokkakensis]
MTQSANRPDALPIYLQISELLIRDIAAGRLVDGQKLPPERDFAKAHGTTVRTLRKALNELEKKGLLERIQGSGNYVRAGGQVESVYSMFRLELVSGGGLPTADILSVESCEKPAGLPPFGTTTQATRIRRLRYLSGTVIAVEEIWLDAGAGTLKRDSMQDSLYRTYKQQLGLWITRAEDRVGLGRVPDWSPQAFPLVIGQTTAFIERLSWGQAPEPVEFSRTWYDTDKALYVQRLI